MEVSECGSMTCNKIKSEESPQQPEEALDNHSCSSSNKQNSIFSLTLDEFQYKSGKSFGSMNMDEFLTSVWNAEGNQASSNSNQNEATNHENVVTTQINPTRQGSLSIPTPLCNKTVEEVWSGIHKNQQNPHSITTHEPPQCQQTLGEMTLEDFLIKAGVIQGASKFSSHQQRMGELFQTHCGTFPSDGTCLDVNFGTNHLMSFEFPNHLNITGNNLLGNGSSMYQTFTESGNFVGESSNNIGNGKCNGVSDGGDPSSKRRITNGALEVAVERRQRRMIKNRESAARSRARKQAYTAELEIEINQLREENSRLKLSLVEAELKQREEVMKGKQSTKTNRVVEKFKTLRRTSSLAW